MNSPLVSILIVHYNTPRLLRQTLKGIRLVNLALPYEIIVVDNNPESRLSSELKTEFSEVRWLTASSNLGFGQGMNLAMQEAAGQHFLIFNPDIVLLPGAIEELVNFLETHQEVGLVAPQLLNPDRSLQYSCYQFMKPLTILSRRLPGFRSWPLARREENEYLMMAWDHRSTRAVDYVLGAVMLVRREAVKQVGGFDPTFFIYFEDQDWCRRFWQAGWQVIYHPLSTMIHYHRRETAHGGLFTQLFNPLTRRQIKSALYYYRKYWRSPSPRSR